VNNSAKGSHEGNACKNAVYENSKLGREKKRKELLSRITKLHGEQLSESVSQFRSRYKGG